VTPRGEPRWLKELSARLGEPVIDRLGTMDRWLWHDGEVGVVIDKLTKVWQVVAFTPQRSVTLRSADAPTERQIRAAVALADPIGAVAAALMADLERAASDAPGITWQAAP
jgi:hypothetical protein